MVARQRQKARRACLIPYSWEGALQRHVHWEGANVGSHMLSLLIRFRNLQTLKVSCSLTTRSYSIEVVALNVNYDIYYSYNTDKKLLPLLSYSGTTLELLQRNALLRLAYLLF